MLRVICDRCKVEQLVDGSEEFTTVATGEMVDEVEVQREFHLCKECVKGFYERNNEHRAKIDELAADRDKIVMPEFESFKKECELLNNEMSDWVKDYVSGIEIVERVTLSTVDSSDRKNDKELN
jgi:hypothetical protein